MSKEIVLTVSESGEITVETIGFKGKSCLKESAFLETVLGKALSTHLTPAYYEPDPDENKAGKKYLNLCG